MAPTPSSASASRYQQSGWFQGAPMTKLISFTSIAFFLILKSNTDLIALGLNDLITQLEFHRLFTYMITFDSIGEILMGLAVFIPLSKRFEKEFGSLEYILFLLKSTTLATILQCFLLSNQYKHLATGIYPIIGALLYLYTKYTPRLHPKFISILGFNLSEKSTTFLFAIQVMGNRGMQSLIPFGAGYIAGILCTHAYSPLNNERVKIPMPGLVYNLGRGLAKTIGLEDLAHSPSYVSYSGAGAGRRGAGTGTGTGTGVGMGSRHGSARSMAEALGNGNGNMNGNRPPLVPGAPPLPGQELPLPGQGITPVQAQAQAPVYQPMPVSDPPSEEAIQTLTAMGFERDAVVRALGEADNHVEHAANRLLSGS